jgi:predicted enzyme related to lactoylglutathione lyase
VHDVDEAAASAERLGGRVVTPPTAGPAGRDAVLADPAGVVFSVSKVVP